MTAPALANNEHHFLEDFIVIDLCYYNRNASYPVGSAADMMDLGMTIEFKTDR
jgi:hypothetical protein